MKAQSLFLVSLLLTNLARAQEEAPLRIAVIAGEGARQYINQLVHVEPVVEVDDEHGKPVEGATVVFTLPIQGPGGAFPSGGQTLNVTTDAQGRATAHGMRTNRVPGPFTIRVSAIYQGRSGSAAIGETNVRARRSAGAFGVSTRTWVLVGLGLVVIAGGIVAAKELRPGRNTNVLTATPGTPTVGGPQ